MKSKSIKSKVMTGIILASLMVGASTGVFAATSDKTTNNTGKFQHQGRDNGFENKLTALVSAGTITSDQETAIKAAITPKDGFKGGNHEGMIKTKLAELVTAGTITSDDQTAIETALTSAKGDFKAALDNLVTAGTITSDKETAIENALKPQGDEKGGEHKNMLKSKLDELVTAGTITSTQETAVIDAFTPSTK
jgi:competence protein ComGC